MSELRVLFLKGRVRWGAPEGVDPAPGTSQGLGASPGAAGVDAETLSPVAAARSHGLGRSGAPEVSFRVGKWGRRWSVRVEAGRGGVLGRATREVSARGGEVQSSRGELRTGHARFLADTTVRVTRATRVAPPNFTSFTEAACSMRGSKRIVRDTPIDTHRQLTPLVMQKKLLMLSALMVALACAHAGETPEVTNKVRHAPTHAPASSSSSDN